ncbi:aldehyde dehydrogenase family protein [Aeromicrobium wangtongii]|uniref:aldehyde dehydrogenase family protein n=1 Tax=Aeromicrobium wangtongii TaxID=2969247 RepID=UPI0020183CC7|nr:aldehyde dehydrogenase family protein [Aeromicrobium wangtongii]MCL3817653.1 aldehyde dehydrogenase family protein [Aeromicrobium wangtongii]
MSALGTDLVQTRVLGAVGRGKPPVHASMSIGGRWVGAVSGARIDCIDPTTEELLGTVPAGGPPDAVLAVQAAWEAQGAWRAMGWTRRAGMLRDLAAAIGEHAEELALLDVLDSGNPIAGMRADIQSAMAEINYFAGLAGQTHGVSTPTDAARVSFTQREPYGVVLRIVPFNHPFKFASGKSAAALAAGNAVIVKPGEETSMSAIALAEIAESVLPPGVFSVVTGTGVEVGDALVSHPDVPRVAFTGSVPTGRAILRSGAETFTHITLELGGKNPLVVCPDVDPRQAAVDAVSTMNIARSNGQSCGSTSRMYVHERIAPAFTSALVDRLGELSVGDPVDEANDAGPLAFSAHHQRVLGHISRAIDEGATLTLGGSRPEGLDRGFFVQPTLFTDVTDEMAIARDEVFGPVQALLTWSDLDDVVARANNSPMGLTANVFTRDLQVAHDLANRLEAGYVYVNGTGRRPPGSPFGGWKHSGMGKENSFEELASYTREKTITITLPPRAPDWAGS